jgi:hypothetical protein
LLADEDLGAARPVFGPPKGNFLGWPVTAVPTAFLNGRGDFGSELNQASLWRF